MCSVASRPKKLRKAMLNYRALFEELVGQPGVRGNWKGLVRERRNHRERRFTRTRVPTRGSHDPSVPRETPCSQGWRPGRNHRKLRYSQSHRCLPANSVGATRVRWENLQVGFVDEPRHAVEQADQLVSELSASSPPIRIRTRETRKAVARRLVDVSTEDLRLAFQRYRSFLSGCSRCKSSSSRGSRSLRGQLFSQRVQHPRPTCFVFEPHFVVGNTRVAQCDLRSPLLAVPGER